MLEKREDWDQIVAALGDRSVKAVAESFGTTAGAITMAVMRTKTQRTPVHAPGAPPPPKPAAGKGREAPATVNGLHVRAGTNDHKIAELADLLGVETDAHVAGLAGVSARTVATFRRRNGISGRRGRGRSKSTPGASTALPPEKVGKSGKKKLRQRGKPSKLDEFAHLLGPRPDAEVAKMAGVSSNAAAAYRRRRGMPSHREWKAAQKAEAEKSDAVEATTATYAQATEAKPAAPAAKSTPAVRKTASARGSGVYEVDVASGGTCFVVADGLAAAAAIAEQHGATGIRFVGALLS